MPTPSAILNTSIFSGQFSLPPFTPYSLLTLNNSTPPFSGQFSLPPFNPTSGNDREQIPPDVTNATVQAPCYSPFGVLLNPDCKSGGMYLGDTASNFISDTFYPYFKSAGLLLLALVLIAFGLYMLANATETGQALKGAAMKAAMA